jgi:hypothetical protein
MIQRAFILGGLMGLTNGLAAGLVIVYFIQREQRRQITRNRLEKSRPERGAPP